MFFGHICKGTVPDPDPYTEPHCFTVPDSDPYTEPHYFPVPNPLNIYFYENRWIKEIIKC